MKREREQFAAEIEKLIELSAEVRETLGALEPFATVHPFRLPGSSAVVVFTDAAEAEPYRIVGGSKHGGRLVDGHRLQPLATITAGHAVRTLFRRERLAAVDPSPDELASL